MTLFTSFIKHVHSSMKQNNLGSERSIVSMSYFFFIFFQFAVSMKDGLQSVPEYLENNYCKSLCGLGFNLI